MSAKEMFEKLGYIEDNYGLIKPSIAYKNDKYEIAIAFLDGRGKGHKIHIHKTGNTYQDSGMLMVEDLQAINKQIEELGWNND